MASLAADQPKSAGVAETLRALMVGDGSAGHEYATSDEVLKGRFATRNLADAVHHLSMLHGRHPGVVDHAATRTAHAASREWMIASVDGFAIERTFLTRLVVAAGPLPSTPGQAATEATVNGQRHAIEMLARSDREGCAVGAAAALVLDWRGLRPLLLTAANRLSVEAPSVALPTEAETLDMIAAVGISPAAERAINFGSSQIIAQHRGLFDLLEARRCARGDY
jgi:hypothetical protein